MAIRPGTGTVTDIKYGSTPVNEIRRGSTLVWTRSFLGDDFNRADAATVGANWTDCGTSTDHKLGIENGTARVKIPEGLLGGYFDLRTSRWRYNAGTASADDGYIEADVASKGDGFSTTSMSGFSSQLLGRLSNGGYTHGVGMQLTAGRVWIVRRVANVDTLMADGGNFQGGDTIRVQYTGYLFTLYVNGEPTAGWDDASHTSSKGAGFRSLGIQGMGGKDLLGPRRFSPAFDSVRMG